MRNIKMTMSKMQPNSKFVNNMLPEWGRFVTAVKLNRGSRDSNYDQLYDYLKQHETHANENKMMLDRFSQHTVTSSNTKNQAVVQDGRVVVQNVQGQQNKGQGTNPRGGGATGFGGVQNRVGNANPNKMLLMQAQENGVALDEEQLLFLVVRQDTALYEDVDEQPVQDLALNLDNVFQADDYHVNDKAEPSYDSDILSEVQDHDHYQDTVCAHHEEHAMDDNVQLNHIVDSHADYTSDSNMISYDQYVKDNAVPVVHSNVSSIPNDAYIMIYNDMYEPHAQSVSTTSSNTVVENSLNVKLATYKEQVKLYERREETLKKELHSVKLQLASTINHNKLMVEEVMFMKKDFKQKENKYPEDILDMKSLKEKVKDRLFKQDQSLQIVHMLCRPKPYYNELNKVAIGYKNPLCLTNAKQVQPPLYNGHEIIKDNHVSAIVHNTEDTLEIAEITRRKMNDKMKDPKCVTHKEIFEGIQKDLTKEIKDMKDVFEELEAKVAQNVVDRKHEAIEWKDLLIENDNLVAECLSKEVFSIATNSELNVARFTEMHVTHTIVETRCLELKARLSNLRDKSHNDNHDELVNHFPILRHLKESVETIRDIVEEAKAVRPLDSSIVFACRYTKHSQKLLEYVIGTCSQDSNQQDKKHAPAPVMALTTENANMKAQILDTVKSVSKEHVKPKVLAPRKYAIDVEPIVPRLKNNREAHLDYLRHLKERVNHCTDASRSQPKSNTKKNRTLPAKGVSKLQVEEQPRKNKSHLRTSNRVDSSSRPKRTHSCYVRDTDGVELIKGSRGSNLYTILVEDMMKSSEICLFSKASKNKSWLWHQRLNHLNFGTINDLARKDLVREEAKVVRPLDRSIVSACHYTQHSQELLEYAIGTCPPGSQPRAIQLTHTPLIRKKQVTAIKPSDRLSRVNHCTDASGSQPKSNTKKNRILPAKGVSKLQVEEQPRKNKSYLRTSNRVDSSSRPKRTVINSNLDYVSQTCNKCLISANHDMCVVDYLQFVIAPPLFMIIVMLCAKLSKFGNLSKLGNYGNLQVKSLPVLVINGDPLAGHSP
nr:retrovirus-related Pol polyprotein from transposon TNT 1-94 [Tanacetum cinerariifolium]